MATIKEQLAWSEVRQLENGEALTGGENGRVNEQAKALANRTAYLKNELEVNMKSKIESNYEELQSAIQSLTNSVDTKAGENSPTLTGVPLVPTASANTNTTQIASTAFVQAAVAVCNAKISDIRLTINSTAPASPIEKKEIWVDTSAAVPLIRVYVGETWKAIGGVYS